MEGDGGDVTGILAARWLGSVGMWQMRCGVAEIGGGAGWRRNGMNETLFRWGLAPMTIKKKQLPLQSQPFNQHLAS